ncbi:Fatty acid amide hydrolase [Nymphaea thermarum]|nr:Fatty acid amide hydrolase [Nymphaea thermarum]
MGDEKKKEKQVAGGRSCRRRSSVCDCGTVEVIGPIAATVEDVLLLYSAILGPSTADRDSLKPPVPCVPSLLPNDRSHALRSLRLGKYSEWFNDVYSDDISRTCENVLNLLSDTYGCTTTEIVLPELHEMQISHSVSIGSEQLCSLNPDSRKLSQLTLDIRINVALFQTFSATDYIAAQRLRRRLMHYHMEAFKTVDVIVTPTTGSHRRHCSSSHAPGTSPVTVHRTARRSTWTQSSPDAVEVPASSSASPEIIATAATSDVVPLSRRRSASAVVSLPPSCFRRHPVFCSWTKTEKAVKKISWR